jgi:hypothetical protein
MATMPSLPSRLCTKRKNGEIQKVFDMYDYSDVGLTYTNQLNTGEMCNVWGSSLGIKALNCLVP